MRTLPTALYRLAGVVLAAVSAVVVLPATFGRPALAAGTSAQQPRPHVDVIELAGLVDAVQLDFLSDAVAAAEAGRAEALVVQLDSGGGIVADEELGRVAGRVRRARVPVAVWVGPSGSRAFGQAFELVRAAAVSGMTSRSRVGPDGLRVGVDRAIERRLVDISAPTLGDFIVELDGRRVGGRTLETAEVVREAGSEPRRRPTVAVRFAKLALVPRLLHTASSPSVAYLLLVAGLALVVLELYTAGIGVAAATGAVCLVLSCFGLAALPTRPWALALLVLAMFGFAVDVQAGAPRTWTAIAVAALAGGSLFLYGDGLAPSPLVLVVVGGGVTLLMISGIPAMVRARFSTPTIGRESLIGEEGSAVTAVGPEGAVEVRGATWRARTNRATPIEAGAAIRVVGIDGLLLEVEPESGGARDYRERRTTPAPEPPA